MNHVLKKLQVAGAGKKKKPKPPTYKPPEMGELQYGASFSYAETLDLISDGPIEGLVNEWGEVMEGINILKGIYLDDTPIAVSNEDTAIQADLSELEQDAMELKSMEIANAATTGKGIRGLRNFFKGINQQSSHSRDGKISTLAHNSSIGALDKGENLMLPHIAFLYLKLRIYNNHEDLPPGWNESGLFIRAFIEDTYDSQRFYWFLDSSLNYGSAAGTSQANAAFRNERFLRGVQGDGGTWDQWSDEGTGFPQSLYWTDANTLDASKFFIGFQPARGQSLGQFTRTIDDAEEFVADELAAILALWNGNNVEGGNPIQKDLAAKALSNLGWSGDETSPAGLLSERVNERKQLFVVVKAAEENNSNLDQTVLDGNGNLLPMQSFLYGANQGWGLENALENISEGGFQKIDVTCPTVDADGKLTGDMHGFVLLTFNYKVITQRESIGEGRSNRIVWNNRTIAFLEPLSKLFADIQSLQYTHDPSGGVERVNEYQNSSKLKFNYSNVLAEVKTGEENQEPLKFFQRIFIDHLYNKELFGPFGTAAAQGNPRTQGAQTNAPQRIHANADLLTRSQVLNLNATNFNTEMEGELPVDEGSDDIRYSRGDKNYSEWGANSLIHWDEKAISSTHTVYNPNVTKAFITLNIQSLQDTLVKAVDNVGGDSDIDFEVGHKFPTVLNIKVETGTLGNYENGAKGGEEVTSVHNYRIVALIEGQTLIDIGNPDNTSGLSNKDFVVNLDERQTSLNIPFKLPPAKTTATTTLNAEGTEGIEEGTVYQDSVQKRFVRVTKLSYETNSVLISKVVMLNKVTEIIEANCPYPFSAIVGTKLDSRAFGSIPKRSFDCKLKLVRTPNNYYPTTDDGKDRRYYKTNKEFTDTTKNNKLVYAGDWNGEFHSELQWTDNPAWILYDLLTNTRYGMGSHIDANKINKWQLYKIGRFCDAVDDDGYFEGVTDGRGGKEPRFSCNVVFDKGQKIYDAITIITEIFRGRVFFGNSEINFVDDRPREPINLFTNESVKEGQFFYSNNRRDQQYNTIEVSFKDRFDNFSPKVEVIEDEEDIKERGVFKTRIEGVGITSRAMARRVGQHKIFASIDENQTVAFTAGLESLLCQPGDLVTIEDELKTNKANFGKILAVDVTNETIRISNSLDAGTMNTGTLTVYNPTGRDTIEGIQGFATIDRDRYQSFSITGFGASDPAWVRYTGDYGFSGYTSGYNVSMTGTDPRHQEYGLYTGVSGTFLYFETGVTGWTFASGTGAGNVGAFDLASGDFIQELTGAQTLEAFNTGKIAPMVMTGTKRESAGVTFSGLDTESLVGPYKGVLNSEIAETSPNQMAVLSITGVNVSDPADLEYSGFNPYGTVVSGFEKPQLLPFVKLGSPTKFEITDASPFIYKVISMKEDAPNEYLVTATKYDTGKFNLIEKDISIENKANTYSYQVAQTINGITYSTLPCALLDNVTTGEPDAVSQTFSITGMWAEVSNGTGYNVRLTQPNGSIISDFVTTTGHEITGLGQVGIFNFCVNALGNKGGDGEVNAYYDSPYDCSGIFVVYDELKIFNRSFVERITIL